jgi:hypothetical protein
MSRRAMTRRSALYASDVVLLAFAVLLDAEQGFQPIVRGALSGLLTLPAAAIACVAARRRRGVHIRQTLQTILFFACVVALLGHQKGDAGQPRALITAYAVGLTCIDLTSRLIVRTPVLFGATRQPAATAAGIAELRRSRPGDLALLLQEASQHVAEGNVRFALPLWREALDHPVASAGTRADIATLLGWSLLSLYDDDPIPAESRRMLELASAEGSDSEIFFLLTAFFATVDGDPGASLSATTRVPRGALNALGIAQLLCLQAVAHHQLGHVERSAACSTEAIHTFPTGDLIPWMTARLAEPR